jgi:hypothetical protein
VYIAGYYNNGLNNIACYWTNGVKTDLPGASGYDSGASSIFVQ